VEPAEDGIESYSDVGSLNSKEEQELAQYFKEIQEENKVEEERMGSDEVGKGAALAAIPEASILLSESRRSKRRASDSDVEVA
jgi:ribonuclease HIII